MNAEHRTDDTGSLLQGLVAKDEIRELVVRYGLGVDGKDPVELKSIFTDDIKFHAANGEFEFQGSDDLVDFFMTQVAAVNRNSLHVTHGHIIDLDPNHPDHASGVLFGHAELIPHDPDGGSKLAALRYDDEYRRVGGKWRFSERCLSFFYRLDAADYLKGIISDTPVKGGETPLPADFFEPQK
ncbi:MAG: nuclear transport factor 2 family protein [Acidimicrobiales bacterium]|nr:nuclear transport factor 2 family protein [Acidimicrobiales bacterium]